MIYPDSSVIKTPENYMETGGLLGLSSFMTPEIASQMPSTMPGILSNQNIATPTQPGTAMQPAGQGQGMGKQNKLKSILNLLGKSQGQSGQGDIWSMLAGIIYNNLSKKNGAGEGSEVE